MTFVIKKNLDAIKMRSNILLVIPFFWVIIWHHDPFFLVVNTRVLCFKSNKTVDMFKGKEQMYLQQLVVITIK